MKLFLTSIRQHLVVLLTIWCTSSIALFRAEAQTVPEITWANPQPITYGAALETSQLRASSEAAGTFAYNPSLGTILEAGTKSLQVTFTPQDTEVFSPATKTVTITVEKAPLIVKADDLNKKWGDADPELTATYRGFVNGETKGDLDTAAVLNTTATTSSPPGEYPITVANATDRNYAIAFEPGTLTIRLGGELFLSYSFNNESRACFWELATNTCRQWFRGVYSFHVSPDGQTVIYLYENAIYSIGINETRGRKLLQPASINGDSSTKGSLQWSPKGDKIAFLMGNGLFIMNPNGSALTEVYSEVRWALSNRGLSWSPDGTRIIVPARRRESPTMSTTGLDIVDVRTGTSTILSTDQEVSTDFNFSTFGYSQPTWSPDGERIAVTAGGRVCPSVIDFLICENEEYLSNVLILNTSGEVLERVTSYPPSPLWELGHATTGAWSPDGTKLSYWQFAPNGRGVYITDFKNEPYKLPDNPNGVTQNGGPLQWFLPSPAVSLTLDIPSERVDLGEIITAKITVRSTYEDPVTIKFNSPPLMIDANGLELVGESVAAEPFVLDCFNPTKEIETRITPTKHGTWEISTAAIVQTTDGTIELSDDGVVIVNPLEITVEALPQVGKETPEGTVRTPIVNMEVEEDPEKPGTYFVTDKATGIVIDPKVKVTVKNHSTQAVTASLQGLDARARDRNVVGARVKTKGEFPDKLGEIAAGKSVTREYGLDIRDDGRFEFVALATGISKGYSKQFNASGKGAPIAVGVAYPVEIEMEFVRTPTITRQGPGAFFVKPGGEIKILATVNNITSNSTLYFDGIDAKKERNAFGCTLTSLPGQAVDPPFAHDHEIEAGSGVVLSGLIVTEDNGVPTGTVQWLFTEEAYLLNDQTGERTEVASDDMLITTKIDGWLNDDYSLRIVQDNVPSDKPILTEDELLALRIGSFSHGALVAMGKWTYDSIDIIGGIGRVAGRVSADPSLLSDAVGEGSRAVWECGEMIHLGWTSMSTAEKEAFILEVSDETYRRAQFLASAPFDKEKREEALQFTRNATYGLFNSVEQAYASDDPAKISEVMGTISGNIAMEVVTAVVPTPKFTKFVEAGELTKLAKAADNIRAPNSIQQQILKTIPSGRLSRALAIEGWGIGGKHLDNVQDALKKLKMKGYARERTPRSLDLSEVLDEAVLKPESMKPKGFSDLDKLIFGKDLQKVKGKPPGNAPLDLEAITALVWPPDGARVASRLRLEGKSEDVVKAVLTRIDARKKEYKKYFPEFKQYREEGIPVKFNYKDNDSLPINPNELPKAKRRFDFETIETADGGIIHVPKMAKKVDDGELRFITGDVDWIHFCHLDGSPLGPKTAGNLYEILERCCGLKHGDTATWIPKGQTIFEGKANQLAEYITGEKALLEVSGDAIRAVRLKPGLSYFAADGRNHRLFFDGGVKFVQKALTNAKIERVFAEIASKLPPKKVVLPFMWLNKAADFAAGSTIDGKPWTYSDDPNAVLGRQGDNGSLEFFDGRFWQPWDPTLFPVPITAVAAANGEGGAPDPLQLTPTTILKAGIEAGVTELPVADFPQDWAAELAGHLDAWFHVGDTVVIAPGSPNQETRKLVSLSPFTLDRALNHSQVEDTMVAVVSEAISQKLDTSVNTYDSWAVAQGLTGLDGAPLADVDHDGHTNLVEFALGTLPRNAESIPTLPDPSIQAGGRATLSIPKPAGVSGINYEVEWSASGQEWSTAGVEVLEDTATRLTVQLSFAVDPALLRLRVGLTANQ